MNRSFRNALLNMIILMTSLMFAAALVEVGVRAFGLFRFPPDDFVEPHPELGWAHIPNKEGYWIIGNERIYVKINSKGLRDKEYSYQKPKGVYRILVLGDSFTEGFQVPLEETFCEVLEKKLATHRTKFEVINAGFAGVGTDYALLFLRREGFKYDPDLVLLAFFGNDIYDNYRSKDVSKDAGSPLAFEERGAIVRIKHFLADNSCAYNYIGGILPKSAPLLAKVAMKLGLLSPQPIDGFEGVEQPHRVVFSKRYGRDLQEAWDVTRLLIRKLKREAGKHGSRLVVVSIPFREQVDKGFWSEELSRSAMKEQEWDLSKPDRLLAQFLHEQEIPVLLLASHFQKHLKKADLYHPVDKNGRDGHWNARGHRLAAEVLYRWLVAERILPVEGKS